MKKFWSPIHQHRGNYSNIKKRWTYGKTEVKRERERRWQRMFTENVRLYVVQSTNSVHEQCTWINEVWIILLLNFEHFGSEHLNFRTTRIVAPKLLFWYSRRWQHTTYQRIRVADLLRYVVLKCCSISTINLLADLFTKFELRWTRMKYFEVQCATTCAFSFWPEQFGAC